MTTTNDAARLIEDYLDALRAGLRGVKEDAVQDFVLELRSHIKDKIAASGEDTPSAVSKVLVELGKPEELASEYKTNALLTNPDVSSSPLRVLALLFRWAGISVGGLFVLLGAIAGYFLGGVLMLCALAKFFYPRSAGLWAFHDATGDLNLSLRLGSGPAPTGAHELLGWWIVPIGLLVAIGLMVATSRLALWCAKRLRKRKVWTHFSGQA
jgi:hypothetical protein